MDIGKKKQTGIRPHPDRNDGGRGIMHPQATIATKSKGQTTLRIGIRSATPTEAAKTTKTKKKLQARSNLVGTNLRNECLLITAILLVSIQDRSHRLTFRASAIY